MWDLLTSTAIAILDLPGGASLFNHNAVLGDYDVISLDDNGKLLAASDVHGNTYVFDVHTRQVIFTLHFDAAQDLTAPMISPDGKTILNYALGTGALDKATLWNIAAKSNVTPADPRWPSEVFSLNYSTDGGVIANYVTNFHGVSRTYLWNTGTRTYIATVALPDSAFISVGPQGKDINTPWRGQLLFFNAA